MNYKYYVEVIRNYEALLEKGYSEMEALYLLAQILPQETAVLLNQGYFHVINN